MDSTRQYTRESSPSGCNRTSLTPRRRQIFSESTQPQPSILAFDRLLEIERRTRAKKEFIQEPRRACDENPTALLSLPQLHQQRSLTTIVCSSWLRQRAEHRLHRHHDASNRPRLACENLLGMRIWSPNNIDICVARTYRETKSGIYRTSVNRKTRSFKSIAPIQM